MSLPGGRPGSTARRVRGAWVWEWVLWGGGVGGGGCGPACGKPGRAFVLRSRCRSRSRVTRRRASSVSVVCWLAVARGVGRLAVAAPVRVVVMTARRAAVKEIWRDCTGWPARRPFVAGVAIVAAARATARVSSTAVVHAGVFLGDQGWGGRAEDRS